MENKENTQDLFDNDEEEFEISNYDGNQEDTEFDNIIGCLQEIVISEEFETLQQNFFKSNYQVFENNDENKMEYMTIFKDYQKKIESYIENELKQMIEGFEMKLLVELLPDRTDQIDEQLLDLLYSFTDFEIFKGLVLDYKKDFEEIERIEKLKTIKQSAKKTLNKADNQISQNKGGNIFQDQNKNKNLFSNQSDPIKDLKNLKIGGGEKKKPSSKSQLDQESQIQQIQGEEEITKSFFIECKSLATPQIQKKSNK